MDIIRNIFGFVWGNRPAAYQSTLLGLAMIAFVLVMMFVTQISLDAQQQTAKELNYERT